MNVISVFGAVKQDATRLDGAVFEGDIVRTGTTSIDSARNLTAVDNIDIRIAAIGRCQINSVSTRIVFAVGGFIGFIVIHRRVSPVQG
ncbi:hypothetical protein D3C78_488850 [compost metagenome]